MKKVFLYVVAVLFTSMSYAQQQNKLDFSKEIDTQLWEKFVTAYNARNAKDYIALHTKDIVRITKSGIRKGQAFRDGIIKSYGRKGQPKRTIAFKFEHRIHSKDIAYEVGYFKVTYYKKQGQESYYGRFSVVLRKEDGRWKIAQDWDVDEINGVKITAADFEKL